MPENKKFIEWCEKLSEHCRNCNPEISPGEAADLLGKAAKLAEWCAKEERCRDISERLDGQDIRISELEERISRLENKKSPAKKSATKKPADKKIYGEFKHVRLTDKEYEKLVQDYGDETVKNYIRDVDEYCEKSGKQYKNHNLAIRDFIRRDKESGKFKSGSEHSYNLDLLISHAMHTRPVVVSPDSPGHSYDLDKLEKFAMENTPKLKQEGEEN